MLDKNWKEKFNEIALEQGKERYMGQRVADLKKDGDHYSAGIQAGSGRSDHFRRTGIHRQSQPGGIAKNPFSAVKRQIF